jgi:hypothetical protein
VGGVGWDGMGLDSCMNRLVKSNCKNTNDQSARSTGLRLDSIAMNQMNQVPNFRFLNRGVQELTGQRRMIQERSDGGRCSPRGFQPAVWVRVGD